MGGSTKLEWNAGGWFGALFGVTAWIGLSGLLSLAHDQRTGLVVLLLFAATVGVGVRLWRTRAQRSCYRATQLLLVLAGISGGLTIYALGRAGIWETIQVGGAVGEGPSYAVLAGVVLGLLILFRVRFGGAEAAD